MKKLSLIGVLCMGLFTLAYAKPRPIKVSDTYRTQGVSSVEPFDVLSVHGQTEVSFRQAPEGTYTVDVSGPENLVELVEVVSQGGTLFVNYKEPLLVLGDHHVRVSVAAPTLKEIHVKEAGEVQVVGPLKAEELKLIVNGKGEIDIDTAQVASVTAHTSGDGEIDINSLTCQYLQAQALDTASFDSQQTICEAIHARASNRAEISLSGIKSGSVQVEGLHAAQIELKGNTEIATLTARGRSEIEAGVLQAEKADVIAENSAKVEVRVSDTLNAQAQGRSSVEYKGWPQQVNRTGKGNIYQDR